MTELLSAEQVAALLKVPEQTLANWRSRKTGPPFVKLGSLVRYRSEMLADWVELQTRLTSDVTPKPGRTVALPIHGGRQMVQQKHRLGRHRTQQDGRDENGGRSSQARQRGQGTSTQASTYPVQ